MFLHPFQLGPRANNRLKIRGTIFIILCMSWKTIAAIIVALLAIYGIAKVLGTLEEKHAESDTYLEETVRSTEKVREMKDDRAETLKEQESMIEEME